MVLVFFSILIIVPYSVLLLYYTKAWKDIPDYIPGKNDLSDLPFISVIIPARNEETNIADCLYAVLKQNYPKSKFEVIVIDDNSGDSTSEIVASYCARFGQVKLVHLADYIDKPHFNSYKKKAIEIGVEHAHGELILTTDADCIAPPNWLLTIASFYCDHHSAMIVAPVSITLPVKSDWLQRSFFYFQILDFATLQGITGAALHRKFHYMANGANLAYPSQVFRDVNGFEGVDQLASGDDMFLLEKVKVWKPGEINYLKSREATVSTFPEQTWKDFFNQRIRWASKSAAYQDYKIKLVLSLVYLVNAWSVILFLAGLFSGALYYFAIFLALKIVFEMIFLFPVTGFFRMRKLLFWFIPLQPVHIAYILFAGWMGGFGSYSWKGRRVK